MRTARPDGEYDEDGEIPERYPLTPLPGAILADAEPTARQTAEHYRARTLKNVQTSDGTAILFSGTLSGGTLLTQKLCLPEKKPFIALDARALTKLRAADCIAKFVEEHDIQVLNVAGPRLSGWPGGYAFALSVMGIVILNLSAGN